VKTVKYEKPEVTASKPAINVIQGTMGSKLAPPTIVDGLTRNEGVGAYEDWE
jgi:hypothetical protein